MRRLESRIMAFALACCIPATGTLVACDGCTSPQPSAIGSSSETADSGSNPSQTNSGSQSQQPGNTNQPNQDNEPQDPPAAPSTPEQFAAKAASDFVMGLWDAKLRPSDHIHYPVMASGNLLWNAGDYWGWVDKLKARKDRRNYSVTIRKTSQIELAGKSEEQIKAATGFTVRDDLGRTFLQHCQSKQGAWLVRVDLVATAGRNTIVDLAYVAMAPGPGGSGQYALVGYRE